MISKRTVVHGIYILVFNLMFMNTTLVAQEAGDEIRRIREISNKVWKGTVNDDIGKYFTDDIIIIKGSGGELIGKVAVEASTEAFKKASPDVYYERTPVDIIVADSNKMAWETGLWKGYNKDGVLPDYGGRYSMMWINTTEGWKMRSQLFVNLK